MSAVSSDIATLQEKLEAAIELREDGDLAESAEVFESILAETGAQARSALEYSKTLRKLDRLADADRILEAAMRTAPDDFELHKAWAEMPRHEVNYQATIMRGRMLRALFPPAIHRGAWESLSVELDCYYEMGDWHALEEAVHRHWDDILAHSEILPHGIGALNKLFLHEDIARLAANAGPQAWSNLPVGARENLLAKVEIARGNLAAIQRADVKITSIGQNCLPYQLAGRWGLIAPRADAAMLTPFDLGGFINDNVADAIATSFHAFERRDDYIVTKAWGGGKMFLHQPTGVGFFHERGTHWVTADGERFFTRLAMMIANWQVAGRAASQLFVFCYCGTGDLAKLVHVVSETLLTAAAHLLIIDVQNEPHFCPELPNITYRHIPYPRNYDWTSVYQQCSDNGFAFEREIAEAIGWCVVKLAPATRDMLPHLRVAQGKQRATISNGSVTLSRTDLTSNRWQFANQNGHVLGERFSFSENGRIDEYENENEASWTFEAGVLKIFKRNGDLMWTSAAIDRTSPGSWRIRLGTHLNPALDLYLVQTGLKSGLPIAQAHRYTDRPRVLLLSNGLDIEKRLGGLLAHADIIRISQESEIEDHPDRNIFISGFALTHATRPQDASIFVSRITKSFALSIFFELNGGGHDYLASFGLRSFHRDFKENAGIDNVNLNSILDAAAPGIYKIEHYADGAAFDSFKDWVVSTSHKPGTMPTINSRGDYRVFDRPIFEFSVFACYGFDAIDLPLADKFVLMEMRALRFRGESSGFRLSHGVHPRDLGRLLYSTSRDAPPRLRELPISAPILFEDGIHNLSPANAEISAKWRAEFKTEIAELSVYELQNCVVAGTGTVFSNGMFVRGTDYLLMFLNSSSLDPIMRGLQNRHLLQHINGVAIVGFNALYDNYYHWVAEAMATISLCVDILEERDLPHVTIITGKLNKSRQEYLDLLLQRTPRFKVVQLERTEFITADTLIYCDNVGRTVHQQVCLEEVPFAEKVIDVLQLHNVKPSRKLYIARTDTAGRMMNNEPEVISLLDSMGFEIFVGSQHSIADQVKAFREARLIVAPHGAGLTNLLFCSPGTIVVEWQQSGYFNTGMMRLAQLKNLIYYSQMFFPNILDSHNVHWEVDIDRAMALIGELDSNSSS